jgi:hypothetical protein
LTSDGRLPLDEQLLRFEQTLRRNRTLTEVLARAATALNPGFHASSPGLPGAGSTVPGIWPAN